MTIHHADPALKPGPGNPRASSGPATLPIETTADTSAGARHALVKWFDAVERHDYRTALSLTRELRRRWRIVVHVADARGGAR